MPIMFSGRLAAFAAAAAIASGCLAGCGSSPAVHVSVELPSGQGTFSFQDAPAGAQPGERPTAGTIQGTVDGLQLTATGTGGGDINCGGLGTTGSSASGTLGGVPFTIKLATCDSMDSFHDTGTYTGDWGGQPIDITVTIGDEQSPSPTTTLTGTIGSQHVTATVAPSLFFVFPDMSDPITISGSMTVS